MSRRGSPPVGRTRRRPVRRPSVVGCDRAVASSGSGRPRRQRGGRGGCLAVLPLAVREEHVDRTLRPGRPLAVQAGRDEGSEAPAQTRVASRSLFLLVDGPPPSGLVVWSATVPFDALSRAVRGSSSIGRLAPRSATSRAASRYASAPEEPGVVGHDRLAVARCLRDADRARHGRASVRSGKCVRTSVATCCARFVRASYIVSRIVDTCRSRVQVRLDELDRLEQLAQPLERVVLALDRDEHLACRRRTRSPSAGRGSGGSRRTRSRSAPARSATRPSRYASSAFRSRVSRATIETSSISAPDRSIVAGRHQRFGDVRALLDGVGHRRAIDQDLVDRRASPRGARHRARSTRCPAGRCRAPARSGRTAPAPPRG